MEYIGLTKRKKERIEENKADIKFCRQPTAPSRLNYKQKIVIGFHQPKIIS